MERNSNLHEVSNQDDYMNTLSGDEAFRKHNSGSRNSYNDIHIT